MAKYTIKDFKVGEEVYQLSNKKLPMTVVDVNEDLNEVSCRWMDKYDQVQRDEFMAEELGKPGDLPPTISYGSMMP